MKRIVLMVVAACLACGSSDGGNPDGGINNTTGSGTANGTVGGHAMTVKAAIFAFETTGIGVIALSDRADACTVLASTTTPTGEITALVVGVINYSGTSVLSLATGDYAWNNVSGVPPAGKYWQGDFGFGTGCTLTTDTNATGGTVTLTQVGTASGTHMKGSYTANFGADTLSGTFDAVYCAALASPGTACQDLRTRPVVLR